MSNLYLPIKVLHILAIISWMAGMLDLPRLFVYHVEAHPRFSSSADFRGDGTQAHARDHAARFTRDLDNRSYLAVQTGFLHAGWFHAKFALVIGLSALHGYFAKVRKDLAEETNRHGSRFFRIVNQAPAIVMAGIVILVVFKPF